jgi:ATP-dependent HslUV protease, peptidase subunit HslV
MGEIWEGTTIVCVRRGNDLALGCDGQITLGNQVIKNSANKLRSISVKDKNNNTIKVLLGFAGSTCDAISLYEELDEYIKEHAENYDLEKIVVEMTKRMRKNGYSKKQAMMIVADHKDTFMMDGSGNAIRPEVFTIADAETNLEVTAIGSGGAFALSAARALLQFTELSVKEIAQEALTIASEICIHTNNHIRIEKITN